MADVLDDPRLHEFIGGQPASPADLLVRYGKLAAGSGNPDQAWLNWIVRLAVDRTPVGTVQATVDRGPDGWVAYAAWVIGFRWQRMGFAKEAGCALTGWLREQGAVAVVANIHPDHHASAKVAAAAGLVRTAEEVDGEVVWRG